MAINISQAFKRTSANPVDESLALTKAQMLTVNDNLMPSKYFTVCQDDGKIYLYDKTNTVDPATGKFRVFEGGGSGGATNLADLEDVLLTALADGQTLVWDDTEEKWVNADMPTVPTKVSELENDSKFVDEDALNDALEAKQDTLTAGDGISIDNDEISVDEMPSEDMSEIISPLPSAQPASVDMKEENNILFVDGVANTALDTISVYVNSSTGVDDYEGGYGFSSSKPFATIEYACNFLPLLSTKNLATKQIYTINLRIQGTFTAQTLTKLYFEFPASRFYLIIDGDTTLTNYVLDFYNCKATYLRVNANLTINCNLTTISSSNPLLLFEFGLYRIDSQNASASNTKTITINGNSTAKQYLRGITCTGSMVYCNTVGLNISMSNLDIAINCGGVSHVHLKNLLGSTVNRGLNVFEGSILSYETNSISATTASTTNTGGRIYTGSQS